MTYAEQMDAAIMSMYTKWPVIKPPETTPETIGDRIRSKREKMGMTQCRFAESMDIELRTLKKWETGETVPSLCSVVELAEATNTSPDWILGHPMDDDLDTLGKRLTYAREESGVLQKELGKAIGKPRYNIANFQSDRVKPTDKELRIMAEMLDVTPEWLEGKE